MISQLRSSKQGWDSDALPAGPTTNPSYAFQHIFSARKGHIHAVAGRPSHLSMRSGEGDIGHNLGRRGRKMAKSSGHPQPARRTIADIGYRDPGTGGGSPAYA